MMYIINEKKSTKKDDTFNLRPFSKQNLRWLANVCSTVAAMSHLPHFIIPILKSLVVPVIWLALIGAIYWRFALFFALNHIFFPANEEATPKIWQWIRFSGLFKVTNQNPAKWRTKNIMWRILKLLFPKLLFSSPQKWMNLISNRLSSALIKYLNWPSPVLRQFRLDINKW